MLTLKVSTMYAVGATGAARAGTIGVYFSVTGTIGLTTETNDTLSLTAPAGTFVETGPVATWNSLGSATILGVVGR